MKNGQFNPPLFVKIVNYNRINIFSITLKILWKTLKLSEILPSLFA